MGEPRFQVGDLVRVHVVAGMSAEEAFMAALERNSIFGIYEVVTLLPEARGEPQYRLKRGDGSPERIARESQLISVKRTLQLRQ